VSRQLLQTFAQDLGKLESEAQKEVAHYALTQIQPRVVSFEEQVRLEFLLQVPAYSPRILSNSCYILPCD
jgi:hypothetical protein